MLTHRLEALGSCYGAIPAHDNLFSVRTNEQPNINRKRRKQKSYPKIEHIARRTTTFRRQTMSPNNTSKNYTTTYLLTYLLTFSPLQMLSRTQNDLQARIAVSRCLWLAHLFVQFCAFDF